MRRYRASERALLLSHEERYGLHRMVGVVAYLTDEGLLTPCFTPIEPTTELADLEVSAHLSPDTVGAYGFHVAFAPHTVELARAVSMARVLRRVERRMRQTQARFGYPGQDFHAFVTQAACALDITRFLIALPPAERSADAPFYRHADADDVRAWIAQEITRWTRQPSTVAAER